ncbi:MAG: TerB family tellurite resistance protein [Sporolactobacillus sp.]
MVIRGTSAILAAIFASVKGRNPVIWFILGYIFYIIAPIVVLFLPNGRGRKIFPGKGKTGSEMRWGQKTSAACPYCGNDVIFDDIPGNWTCPHCGNTFTYSSDGHLYKIRDDQVLPQLEWIVKLFAKLAKQDGVVTENEINQVDQIVRQAFQPNHDQLKKIMTVFNEARYTSESFDEIAENLYLSVGGRQDILVDTLTALLAIGYADGTLLSEEEALIRRAASIFRMDQMYESIKARFAGQTGRTDDQPSLETSYQLLGCTPEDSEEVIRKKYRQQIKANHPDRLMSSGASEAQIKEANTKIAAIKKAYEQILAAKG